MHTDNNPLTYVLTSAKLDATGHRWIAALSNFNFRIQYQSGKQNADADGLSQIPINKYYQEDDGYEELSSDVIKTVCKQNDSRYLDNICMSAQVLEAVEMVIPLP